MRKKNRLYKGGIISLSFLLALGLGACTKVETSSTSSYNSSTTSSSTSSASSSSSEDSSSSSVEEVAKPEVTVSPDLEVEYGEDVDVTSFFTVTYAGFTYETKAEWITGEVNTHKEGTYPLTLATDIEIETGSVHLEATANVEVVTKVEINTPRTEHPYYSGRGDTIPTSTLLTLFEVYINDREVDVDPSWLSGEIGHEFGETYPLTLNVPVNKKTYSKTVYIYYTYMSTSLYASYSSSSPYEITQNTMTADEFDWTSLYSVSTTGYNVLVLVDKDKATESDINENTIVGEFDKSAVDFNTPGVYPVTVTGTINNYSTTVTSYIEILSDVEISASAVSNSMKVGATAPDLASLFTITKAGEAVDSSLVTISGTIDTTTAGNYPITATYEGVSYSRTIMVLDADFYGTYKAADLASSGYDNEVIIKEDGTAELNYIVNSRTIHFTGVCTFSDSGTGNLYLTSDGGSLSFDLDFDFKDGLLYSARNSTFTTSTFFTNFSLFYKTSEMTYSKRINTTYTRSTSAYEVVDIVVFTDSNDEEIYLGIYRYAGSSRTNFYDVYLASSATLDGTSVTVVFPSFGTATYTATISNEEITALAYTSLVLESQINYNTILINGQQLTNLDDETSTLTLTYNFNVYSNINNDIYTASGTYLTGYSGSQFRLISFDSTTKESIFIATLGSKDSNNNTIYSMKKIKVNGVAMTFEEVEEEEKAFDGSYSMPGSSSCWSFSGVIAGDYGSFVFNGAPTSFYSYQGTITYLSDNLIRFEFFEDNNYGISETTINYFTAKLSEDGNTLIYVEGNWPSSSSTFYTTSSLVSDVRGIGILSGTSVTVPLNSETALTATDLFTGKRKDSEGNIIAITEEELTITGLNAVDYTTSGNYTVYAEYTSGDETIYASAVITVASAPFQNLEMVGSYTGYWSMTSYQGEKTFTIDEDGYFRIYNSGSTTASYSCYLLASTTDGIYDITINSIDCDLMYIDGVIYIRSKTTESSQVFMIGAKTTENLIIDTEHSCLPDQRSIFTMPENNSMLLTLTDGTSMNSYFVSRNYCGKVYYEDKGASFDAITYRSGSTSYTFDAVIQYHLLDSERNSLCDIRHYRYNATSTRNIRNVVLVSDASIGTYTDTNGTSYVLDGYNSMTVTGAFATTTEYTYYLGLDDKIYAVDADSNVLKKQYSTETNSVSDITKDSLAGHTFLLRGDFQTSQTTSSYRRMEVYLEFDGYGFATLTTTQVSGSTIVPYSIQDNKIVLGSLSSTSVQVEFTLNSNGNYTYNGDYLTILYQNIVVGTSTSTTYSLYVVPNTSLIDVTND